MCECTCNHPFPVSDSEFVLPNSDSKIKPGYEVVLDRFSTVRWVVGFGWYRCDGNRETCGWYLKNKENTNIIKPLLKTDLYDIYIVFEG